MKIGVAYEIIGSIGHTSKMPGTAYGLPAAACKTGAKLAQVPGTVCHDCYALKGNYMRGNAEIAHQRRLAAIQHPKWVGAMIVLLRHLHKRPIKVDLGAAGVRLQKQGGSRFIYQEPGWHRWHDSGDLQSVEHLRRICEVARCTSEIRHWLPTQELTMVKQFLDAGGVVPANLIIRVSMPMVLQFHSKSEALPARAWEHLSTVFDGPEEPAGAHICPAPSQDHKCGTCRACWSRYVPHVAYRKH